MAETRPRASRSNYVQAWRKVRGLTQESLAALVGCSSQTISQIETGGRGARLEMLYRIADVLGVEPGWLLSRNPAAADLWAICSLVEALPDEDRERTIRIIRAMLPAQQQSGRCA